MSILSLIPFLKGVRYARVSTFFRHCSSFGSAFCAFPLAVVCRCCDSVLFGALACAGAGGFDAGGGGELQLFLMVLVQ